MTRGAGGQFVRVAEGTAGGLRKNKYKEEEASQRYSGGEGPAPDRILIGMGVCPQRNHL